MRSAIAENFPRPAANFTGPAPGTAADGDPQLAQLFSDLRRVLQLSVDDVARHLSTQPDVILALERGMTAALPSWAETVRIVSSYTRCAGIDPRPILDRIAATPSRPAAVAPARWRPGGSPRPDTKAAALGWDGLAQPLRARLAALKALWRGLLPAAGRSLKGVIAALHVPRHPVRWVSAAALILALVVFLKPLGMLQASVSGLSPVSGILRSLSDQLTLASAPMREGHRWIEVEDPRSRRGDKLPSPRS